MKIVLNKCYGGFSVSEEAYEMLWPGKGKKYFDIWCGSLDNDMFYIESDNNKEYRSHPDLIEVVETLGSERASGDGAKLEVVNINFDTCISGYDGNEVFGGRVYEG